jgi:hypothetical protein
MDKFLRCLENIAIALYYREEDPTIGKLCHDLDPIQTRLFTGEQTTQELITKINAWLLEM